MDYPEDVRPAEGERVVTNSVADAFPAGLPVGTVHYVTANQVVVEPYARLDHVSVVRVFDYGLSEVIPPEAPGRLPPRSTGPVPAAPSGRLPDPAGTAPVGRG